MKIMIAAAAACVLLAGCSASQLATVQSDLGTVQAGAVKFCTTDQPVIGVVATVVTAGIAAGVPTAAAAAPITGMIVQDVNGFCAGITAVPVPAPPAGTQVVVPAAAPGSTSPAT